MSEEQKPTGEEPTQTEEKKAKEAYQAAAAEKKKKSPLPRVDFNTFVLSLSSTVMVHLGEVNNPETGESDQDLDLARHTIDMLDMLGKKTQGNLDADEERLLKNILFEMRMKFLQKTK